MEPNNRVRNIFFGYQPYNSFRHEFMAAEDLVRELQLEFILKQDAKAAALQAAQNLIAQASRQAVVFKEKKEKKFKVDKLLSDAFVIINRESGI